MKKSKRMIIFDETVFVAQIVAISPKGLIAIDGFDGAGKTTLAKQLSSALDLLLLYLDSFLLKQTAKSYTNDLDFQSLAQDICAAGKSVIVSGICILDALDKMDLSPSVHIYVKFIAKNGLWHQGWDIDNDRIDGNWFKNEVLQYHRRRRPHEAADYTVVREK